MLPFICRQVPQIGCQVSLASHNEVKVQCHGRINARSWSQLLIQHSEQQTAVITVTGAKWGQMGAAISWRFEKAPRVSCFSSTGQRQEEENNCGAYMQANEARLLRKI